MGAKHSLVQTHSRVFRRCLSLAICAMDSRLSTHFGVTEGSGGVGRGGDGDGGVGGWIFLYDYRGIIDSMPRERSQVLRAMTEDEVVGECGACAKPAQLR